MELTNMLNKVILIGHLGANPESKTMPSGGEVVNFRMATSESYIDKATNKKVDKTEWHSIVVFNPHLAKVALQYLSKGRFDIVSKNTIKSIC
ncbi:single-strand binding protein (fragment) [Bartonella grahamii as4aup]|uniref:Single-stranded DNA-binding protein n=1 Tax=Bartonella grahamii (strain as4aup) TaxID=634504 RepID=C6AD15_BARGA